MACCGISRAVPTCMRVLALVFICAGLGAPHWEVTLKSKLFTDQMPKYVVKVGLFDACIRLETDDHAPCADGTHSCHNHLRRLEQHDVKSLLPRQLAGHGSTGSSSSADSESCTDPMDAVDNSAYPTEWDDDIKNLLNGGRTFLFFALIAVGVCILLSIFILAKSSLGACAVRKCCCISLVGVCESIATLITKLGTVLALAATGLFGWKYMMDYTMGLYELDEARMLAGGVLLVFACILLLVANFLQCCCVKEVPMSGDDEEEDEGAAEDGDVVKSTEVEAALDADEADDNV